MISDHVRGLLRVLRLGLASDKSIDLVFVCADRLAVPAHRAVVSTFSAFLSRTVMSSSESPFSTDRVTIVHLPDFTADGVVRLLELAYTGDCGVKSDEEAAELAELLALVGVDWSVDAVRRVNKEVQPGLTGNPMMNLDEDDDDDDDALIEMVVVETDSEQQRSPPNKITDTSKVSLTKTVADDGSCVKKINPNGSGSRMNNDSAALDKPTQMTKTFNGIGINGSVSDKSAMTKIVNESGSSSNTTPTNKSAGSAVLTVASPNGSSLDRSAAPKTVNGTGIIVRRSSGSSGSVQVSKPAIKINPVVAVGGITPNNAQGNNTDRSNSSLLLESTAGSSSASSLKLVNVKGANRGRYSVAEANGAVQIRVPIGTTKGASAARSAAAPYDHRLESRRASRYSEPKCPLPDCGETFTMKAMMRGHFVKHFAEEVREHCGFDEAETRCPRCRCELSQNLDLVVHVGLQHRVIAEVVDDPAMLEKIDIVI